MRKIGVFTAYQPYVKLTQDGLGRLLIYIIGGMVELGDDVTILCPSWHKKEVKTLLKEHLLEKTVHIKTPFLLPPPLFLFYDLRFRRHLKKKSNAAVSEKRRFRNIIRDVFFAILGGRSLILLFIIGILSLPVVLLYLAFIFVRVMIRKIFKMRNLLFPARIKRYFQEFNPRQFRADLRILTIWEFVRKHELNKMIKIVNKGNIDLWYVPGVFWPEVTKIKRKYALVVPDIVFADFPQIYYQDVAMLFSAQKIDRMLKKRLPLVCYSNYVADYQLSHLRNIRRSRIKVIPHGLIDISSHLKQGLSPEEIIKSYLEKRDPAIPNLDYVLGYPWKEGRFILYSSQYRYHKNIKLLLKVVAKLIHEEYYDLKLVLTCANYTSLLDIIEDLNLSRDVIILPSIPESVLAALNALAVLHVNPSLFEGAFPFTFGEAYSAGTPSVMADIPVTREIVRPEEAEYMLFDPFDEFSMTEKIKWGLAHRNELLEKGKPIFERLSKRSWKQVAEEYISAMRVVNQHERLPKRRKKRWKRS